MQVLDLPARSFVDVVAGKFSPCIICPSNQLMSFYRSENGECLNLYAPPPGADPGNKKCSCTSGCILDGTRVGSGCGCASLGVGCSDACGCQGTCHNGHR